MIPLTLAELQAPLNAQLHGEDLTIEQVSTDTRQAMPKGLFIALVGERFDAHEFADKALEQGAIALIVERKLALNVPQLVVANCRIALGQVGSYLREKLGLACCAITGSNGKTTVKEMCGAILTQSKQVLATQGNFNNDIGVPLSLLRAEPQHEVGVLELGANHIGEIAYTVNLVKPQAALINNVSDAHIEGFGDQHGVLKAKSELFLDLTAEQTAICELGSEYQAYLDKAASPATVQHFSLDNKLADFFASNINSIGLTGSRFSLHTPLGQVDVQINLAGEHNVKNAVAAAALAMAMGANLQHIQRGLASLEKVPGRVNLQSLSASINLIDDSYNANPASFNAAVDILASFEGKRFLIAGAMGEMGQQTKQVHKDLVSRALDSNISLYSYGASFDEVLAEIGQSSLGFDSHDTLVKQLIKSIEEQAGKASLVLVKGSRSTHMENVVKQLQQYYKKGLEC
ncbi:UDP-N-acetylmuramoyl-tripeptide--D-alanyl-D-alanine ligase [Agarivorans sp. Toyoura001]|uniref:UDP-N-acetylmuramoyl-tripeptide--D-alanyl-D- alanine ligase n=1 Tax=Agarivorans sp. Toyoura001 TaxID=2283141 RepID=UPI0010DE093A|nr:UDP-N-acetylmuramoyl-tripeptide--D-alanyl-D-alanine ligase [Agarivorans sp. Toyoura001]GDY26534.1 UDP-N-acetylmuramoyl-tripeptide--D-alanyl-D-alanine ligase [Agarivorans sp. Toyoura001]